MLMSISSNIDKMAAQMAGFGSKFDMRVDRAVGKAAKEFLKDCIAEIDALIYSQKGSSVYKRTKNLRRSHHIRRIVLGIWLVFNDADYAIPVHDGWSNRKGGSMPARSWMEIAKRKNAQKYKNTIADDIKDIFE
jgi:hypothetical protein